MLELNSYLEDRKAGLEDLLVKWSDFLYKNVNFYRESQIHGRHHCQRVLLYALLLADDQGLELQDKERLALAAVFHDSQRYDDGFDTGHGQRGAEAYRSHCQERGAEADRLIYWIIYYHDLADDEGLKHFSNDEHGKLLFQTFKDADGLDRFRLGEQYFDAHYLRKPQAHNYIHLAKELNAEH